MKVTAVRYGTRSGVTSNVYVMHCVVPFVALPAARALGKFVLVRNCDTGIRAYAIVLDVGPWNCDDELYVFCGGRPQAESGKDKQGRETNGAGIVLSEGLWAAIGMVQNGDVEWQFLRDPNDG